MTKGPPSYAQIVAPVCRPQCGASRITSGASSEPGIRRRRAAMALAVSLVLLPFAVGCASIRPQASPAHIGFIASSIGDVASTRHALAAGATELNPLLGQNPATGKIVGLKVVGWTALRALERKVEKDMRRRMKWWEQALFWAIPTGLNVWLTTRNLSVARGLRGY